MILYQRRGVSTNFGDELNGLLWPRLLPAFFDQDPSKVFLGIGSVLDSRHDGPAIKLVAGAGFGGYESRPVLDDRWIIHWVRGPHTARVLGLPPEAALGDPAALLPMADLVPSVSRQSIGLMPHFESMVRRDWLEVARRADVTLIDPRGDPATILAAIGSCHLLLSEALHGVIVADTFRVPWVAIEPSVRLHRGKWLDWADQVGVTIRFQRLPAPRWQDRIANGPLHRLAPLRRLVQQQAGFGESERSLDRCAVAVRRSVLACPTLSASDVLRRSQARMADRLRALRRSPMTGAACHGLAARPFLLHADARFAYDPGPTG